MTCQGAATGFGKPDSRHSAMALRASMAMGHRESPRAAQDCATALHLPWIGRHQEKTEVVDCARGERDFSAWPLYESDRGMAFGCQFNSLTGRQADQASTGHGLILAPGRCAKRNGDRALPVTQGLPTVLSAFPCARASLAQCGRLPRPDQVWVGLSGLTYIAGRAAERFLSLLFAIPITCSTVIPMLSARPLIWSRTIFLFCDWRFSISLSTRFASS